MWFIGGALELLRRHGFTNERPGAPNIAIVITDGLSADPVATKQQVIKTTFEIKKKNKQTPFNLNLSEPMLKLLKSESAPNSPIVFDSFMKLRRFYKH